MAKLDFKWVMIVVLVVIVTLLNDSDASRRRSYSGRRRSTTLSRRRTVSYSRRRRSSYGSSRSMSTGLYTGLIIFGVFASLITIGVILGCCFCRKSRERRLTGSIVTPQPVVQFRTEYQTGSGSGPPPYTPSDDAYANPMMNQSPYPPSGAPPVPYPTKDSTLPYPSDGPNQPLLPGGNYSEMYLPPPGAPSMPYPTKDNTLPYPSDGPNQPLPPGGNYSEMYPPPPGAPSMPYPTKDNTLPYPSDGPNQPPYLPPGGGSQPYVPPQELQGAVAAPYPYQVPPVQEPNVPSIPPPSYNEVVKDSQGATE